MERLTSTRPWSDAQNDLSNEPGYGYIWQKLQRYEETGLEPEEIRDSIGGISPICVQCDGKTSDGVVTEKCGYPDDITKCLEQSKHLCELAQAEKEGRLVVLPFSVAKHIYRIVDMKSHSAYNDFVTCERVLPFGIPIESILGGARIIPIEQFGKTVFLTREAAEAALEEMEAEHDR